MLRHDPDYVTVGGLIDTIVDAGTGSTPCKGANGILFEGERPADMIVVIDRAFDMFSNSVNWLSMQRHAMSGDFSWNGPARKYIRVYAEIASASARKLFVEALSAKPG